MSGQYNNCGSVRFSWLAFININQIHSHSSTILLEIPNSYQISFGDQSVSFLCSEDNVVQQLLYRLCGSFSSWKFNENLWIRNYCRKSENKDEMLIKEERTWIYLNVVFDRGHISASVDTFIANTVYGNVTTEFFKKKKQIRTN